MQAVSIREQQRHRYTTGRLAPSGHDHRAHYVIGAVELRRVPHPRTGARNHNIVGVAWRYQTAGGQSDIGEAGS